MQQTLRLVESFSGPGGLSLGLGYAGFDLALAFDFDEKAVATHNFNLDNKCEHRDAREVDGGMILDHTGLCVGELDLFSGGPPCQGFSKQKRGAHLGDDRNRLVLEFSRLVTELQPKFFLFENVAICGMKRGRLIIREMLGELVRNYEVFPHFYNAADYGVPQTRERFIVVGQRNDLKKRFQLPRPLSGNWPTVGQALSDLPSPPEDFSVHPDYPNHQKTKISALNIERFSHVPQGGGWQDIPAALRLPCHQKVDLAGGGGGWPDVYGRLKWDGQCPTITGGFDSFTRGRYGHPRENRALTPREAARIQGFPDWFQFMGNRSEVRSQIGNAVPPPLAKAIGLEIRRSLLGETENSEDVCSDVSDPQLLLFN